MKKLLLSLLLLAPAALAAPSDESVLRQLDHDITTATWKSDAAWFDEHLAAGYVLTTSSGKVVSREALLDSLRTPLQMEPYEPSEVVIRVYGETAVITGRIDQRYVVNGEAVDADLRYTDVWLKSGGVWKYAAGHASAISIKRSKVVSL